MDKKKDEKKIIPNAIKTVWKGFFDLSTPKNIIERQRIYVLAYIIIAVHIGVIMSTYSSIATNDTKVIIVSAIDEAFFLLIILLYRLRKLSVHNAIWILLLFIQSQISLGVLASILIDGKETGAFTLLVNTSLMTMFFILSVVAYIRYLPYILTVAATLTLSISWYLTGDQSIGYATILLPQGFIVLSIMGTVFMRGINDLQESKEKIEQEEAWFFNALNLNKEEAFRILRRSQRKNLSEKQKEELINSLGEQTKNLMLEAATEIVEKKNQNLAVLDAQNLGLTPYEKEVCVMILQKLSISDIADKLYKSASAITTIRGTIRTKLGLQRNENLFEALVKLVES